MIITTDAAGVGTWGMAFERVTQLLGVLATVCVIALVLALRARTASGAGGEAILLFIVLAPAIPLVPPW